MAEDRDGNLWIGTMKGLNRLSGGRIATYHAKDGLSDDTVLAIAEDREGSLWVGTVGAVGLNRFRDGKFLTYSVQEGLPSEKVWSIYQRRDGSMLVGAAGVSRFKDGKFTTYIGAASLTAPLVRTVIETRDGSVWLGGDGGGLSRFRDGRLTKYTKRDGLASKDVRALAEDRDGNLWIGTSGGLNRFRNGEFVTYTRHDGFPECTVYGLHPAKDGSLWIGGSEGLFHRKNNRFTAYTTKDGLSSPAIKGIYEDAQGTLWIGTDGGLNRFKDGRFTALMPEDGLADEIILEILEDAAGYLWLSGPKGLFRVRKDILDAYAAGKIGSISGVSYDRSDGLRSEPTGGSSPAGYKANDGRLWFPTNRGVVVIDPARIPTNQLLPPVVIEEIVADRKRIASSLAADLPPGSGELEFHYTALSLAAPEKIRFQYKLEGFDKEWIDAGSRRIAYYTNIPPGRYRFRVIASNNDGVWNREGASLDLHLRPHFYQTYWFYGLCCLLIGLSGASAYLIRVNGLKLRERELGQRVDERTRELRQEVAERARVEVALRLAEEKYRGIFQEAIVGIFQTSPDGSFLSANPAMARIMGYSSPAELMADGIGLALRAYVDPGLREEFKRQLAEFGVVERFEYEAYRKDGARMWLFQNARAVCDVSGAVLFYVGTVEDITARKRAEEELEAARQQAELLAVTDPLTGILNRRGFFERAERDLQLAIRLGTPLSVVSFDIDHFKRVNDTYGHSEGDRLLCEVVAAVRKTARATDLFGRMGGEEFLVVMPNTSLKAAAQTAERMRAAIAQDVGAGPRRTPVTASFGVASVPEGSVDLEWLQSAADAALYSAKHNGRNRVEAAYEMQGVSSPSDSMAILA